MQSSEWFQIAGVTGGMGFIILVTPWLQGKMLARQHKRRLQKAEQKLQRQYEDNWWEKPDEG